MPARNAAAAKAVEISTDDYRSGPKSDRESLCLIVHDGRRFCRFFRVSHRMRGVLSHDRRIGFTVGKFLLLPRHTFLTKSQQKLGRA